MKPLEKDELYQHVSGYLKNKGVELKEGSYARTIQKSCGLLADAINLGNKGFDRAKTEIDRKLDQMRQVIHEKTAPKKSAKPTGASGAQPTANSSSPGPKPPPIRKTTRPRSKSRKPRSQ